MSIGYTFFLLSETGQPHRPAQPPSTPQPSATRPPWPSHYTAHGCLTRKVGTGGNVLPSGNATLRRGEGFTGMNRTRLTIW